MFRNLSPKLAAPVLIGLGLIGAAAGASRAEGADGQPEGPVRCAIDVGEVAGGMLSIEGVVAVDLPVSGSYTLRVVSAGGPGSVNIQQGGLFEARPGDAVSLGQVMLGGHGAVYDVDLTVNSSAGTATCRERVGAAD